MLTQLIRPRLMRAAVLLALMIALAAAAAVGAADSAESRPNDLTGLPAVADLSDPGPYQPAWQAIDLPGGVDAKIYYPATSAGQNGAYDGSGAPYPVIAYGHGFLQHPDRYKATLDHLATYGYFVIAPESELGLLPSHQGLADDMNSVFDYMEAQNAESTSWLFNQVDVGAYGLSGHSMGGGASILAAAGNPDVRAVVNMAAAETSPSAINQMPAVDAPILLLAGSQDGITPVAQHQQPMYDNGVAPRQLAVITGGYHCGFQSDPFFLFCDSGSISLQEQLAITHRRTTAFFNLYLKEDMTAWQAVWGYQMLRDGAVATQFDAGLAVSAVIQNGSGQAGSSVPYSVTLTNTTDGSIDWVGQYQSLKGWSASFSASSGTLPAGGSTVVTVTVNIPPGTPANVRDTGLITVLDSADNLSGVFTAVRTRVTP